MTRQEKQTDYQAIYPRYQQASRQEKSRILDEFCSVCGYQRKYAIRKLGRPSATNHSGKKPGRVSRYQQPDVVKVVREIGFATDQMCGKRLAVAIPEWLPHYEKMKSALPKPVREAVLSVSPATLDRILKPLRVQAPKGLSGPALVLQIPIRSGSWDVSQAGFMEADTVAHCGNSLTGDFVWSLTLTDMLTGWTECRATWNKGASGVVSQIKAIEQALTTFSLVGL